MSSPRFYPKVTRLETLPYPATVVFPPTSVVRRDVQSAVSVLGELCRDERTSLRLANQPGYMNKQPPFGPLGRKICDTLANQVWERHTGNSFHWSPVNRLMF